MNHRREGKNLTSVKYLHAGMPLLRFLFILYIYISLFIPAIDILYLKKVIFFFMLLIFTIDRFLIHGGTFNRKFLERLLLVLLLALIWAFPTFPTADFGRAITLIMALSGLSLVFIISLDRDYFFEIFLDACLLLSLVVCVIAVLPIVNMALSEYVNGLFLAAKSGFLGVRNFGRINLTMIHFRTSPILVIPEIYYFSYFIEAHTQKDRILNGIKFALVSAAIFLSASRGLMLFAVAGLVFLAVKNIKRQRYEVIAVIMVVAVMAITLYLVNRTSFFLLTENSNSIKINHILSFFDWAMQNLSSLFVGQGLGSSYYSSGFNGETWQTEIALLDIFRYFGIPVGICFVLLMITPFGGGVSLTIQVAFVSYLSNAFLTNPLVFNSTGVLVIAFLWALTIPSVNFRSKEGL